jgi:hypothetical protein
VGELDPLYQGLPGYQQAFQWHEDGFELPMGAISLAHHTRWLQSGFSLWTACLRTAISCRTDRRYALCLVE